MGGEKVGFFIIIDHDGGSKSQKLVVESPCGSMPYGFDKVHGLKLAEIGHKIAKETIRVMGKKRWPWILLSLYIGVFQMRGMSYITRTLLFFFSQKCRKKRSLLSQVQGHNKR